MMTKKRGIITLIFILILVLATIVYNKTQKRETQWASITFDEKALLVSGDIVFTEGHSFKSDLVRMSSGVKDSEGQHYSHCGFILVDQGDVYVVHMSIDDDVIVKEPIDSFWSNNKVNSYTICRVEGFNSTEAIKDEFDELLLNEVSFDNSYIALDNQELYCTELICYVLKKVSNLNLYPFEDLEKIIYPNNLYEILKQNQIL